MPCIRVKDSEAASEEALEVDQDLQEVVVEATTEETVVASEGTKNLTTPKIETILKQNPKTNRQRPLIKGATTTIKIMTGEDRALLDNKADRGSGVLIVAKLRTTQLNVGATRRKR